MTELQLNLRQGRYTLVSTLAERRLQFFPQEAATRLILAEAAQRSGDLEEALRWLNQVDDQQGEPTLQARTTSASILTYQGELLKASDQLQRLPAEFAEHPLVVQQKITIATLSGQRWESRDLLRLAIEQQFGDPLVYLAYLANLSEMPAPPDEVFAKIYAVGDPLGLLGSARVALSVGRLEQAQQLLTRCVSARPDMIEARVQLGTVLIDSGKLEEFRRWYDELPPAALDHPQVWALLGRLAQAENHRAVAIRCYWEALRRFPDHERACYQLSQLLSDEQHAAIAEKLRKRSAQMLDLRERATRLYLHDGSQQDISTCVRRCIELGRLPEANGWLRYLSVIFPQETETAQLRREIDAAAQQEVSPGEPLPWLLPSQDLAAQLDFSSTPVQFKHQIDSGRPSSPSQPTSESTRLANVHFRDDAYRLGIQFRYRNGSDPKSLGSRMFEYTGGGIGVIDYDLDGWPECYLTQGSDWPNDPAQRVYLDLLYRNQRDRFEDVSTAARILDPHFGQGISVGDFNQDGFPDLYIANIGGNRLLENLGDGTFRDVTEASGVGHTAWSTSVMIADLNEDGLPDIFDATFVAGEDIYYRSCETDGRYKSCAPGGFACADDVFYVNNGDGTFRDATREFGFDSPNGDGLGLLLADYDHSGRLSLYVANDGRASFFYAPRQEADRLAGYEEIGVTSGLAFDEVGATQANMGVAAGDPNNDGLPDLYVTNFYLESGTYYANLGSLEFSDLTRSCNLYEATNELLGFGTQMVDADADGWEDILVTNGHVDDFTYKNLPYKMPAQFFQNREGRFFELPASSLGPFFKKQLLGRAMATLDWNRDGLVDAAISHLDEPAALLTNTTENVGHWVGVQLSGRTRSRDAIGTRVIARQGERTLERQLFGGDGYQATNQKRLLFGLGDSTEPVVLEVHWPGGAVETFPPIAVDGDYRVIEGRGKLFAQPVVGGPSTPEKVALQTGAAADPH